MRGLTGEGGAARAGGRRRRAALAAVVLAGGLTLGVAPAQHAGASSLGTVLGVEKGLGVFAMAADGAGQRVIISDPTASSVAAAPRDGLIAYGDSGSGAVTVADTSGARLTSIDGLGAPGTVTSIAWAPDGQEFAFTVCATGTSGCQIGLASAHANWTATLTPPSGVDPDQGLTWGSHGLVVAGDFTAATACPGCSAGFYLLDPSGQSGTAPIYPSGAPAPSPSGKVGMAQPAVAADGSLAYVVRTSGHPDQVFANGPTGPRLAVYDGSSAPAWSPDASTLVVTNGYQVLESRPSIGGAPQVIATFHAFGVQSLTWAPGPPGTGCSLALPGGSVQSLAAAPNGQGYWVTDAYGAVSACGDTGDYGGLGAVHLNQPVLGVASTPDGRGYWLVAYDGGVFTFGDARPEPQNGSPGGPVSLGGRKLAAPIWTMAATPSGHGYLLVGTDGGVFTFGDALFYGSAAAFHPSTPVVGIAVTPDGGGYWLTTANGTVFAFGDAHGPHAGIQGPGSAPIVAIAADRATPQGYWLVDAGGAVHGFGGAPSLGSLPSAPSAPVRGMASTPDGTGYWLVDSNGIVYPFGRAVLAGSAS